MWYYGWYIIIHQIVIEFPMMIINDSLDLDINPTKTKVIKMTKIKSEPHYKDDKWHKWCWDNMFGNNHRYKSQKY